MNLAIYDYIKDVVSEENAILSEPLSKHTTFKVGGEADCFVRVGSKEELSKLLSLFERIDQEYFVLGNGSNLLVSDKGYRGVILQIKDRMNDIVVENDTIRAEAGALMSAVAKKAMEHELSGLEFAGGIPGTVGGGVVMNAGAYDGAMGQVVEKVVVMNYSGEIMEIDNDTMKFGYRTSAIKNRPFIVLETIFKLEQGKQEDIKNKAEEFASLRREKQPLSYPSAGSTFKRPQGHFAGKLIMDAGLRGQRLGGAQVSEKHCGFIINTGNATATDIYELMHEVRESVEKKFGIVLQPEIICLGEM